jgi:hypothetical protein
MGAFTDNNLTKLKNILNSQKSQDELDPGIFVDELKALILRMEAAETLLESYLTIIPSQDRSVSMDREEEAWRRSKGVGEAPNKACGK